MHSNISSVFGTGFALVLVAGCVPEAGPMSATGDAGGGGQGGGHSGTGGSHVAGTAGNTAAVGGAGAVEGGSSGTGGSVGEGGSSDGGATGTGGAGGAAAGAAGAGVGGAGAAGAWGGSAGNAGGGGAAGAGGAPDSCDPAVYVSHADAAYVSRVTPATLMVSDPITLPAAHGNMMAFSADGRRLYVATAEPASDVDLVVIDTACDSPSHDQVLRSAAIDATVNGVVLKGAWSIYLEPAGKRAYVASSGNLAVLDMDPCSVTYLQPVGAVLGTTAPVEVCAFAPAEVAAELWCCEAGSWGTPSKIAVVDTSIDQAIELALPDGLNPQGISFSRDGSEVYVSDWGGTQVTVFDRFRRAPKPPHMTDGRGFAPRGNAVSPDGSALFVVTDGATVLRKYDLATKALLGDLELDGTMDGVHRVSLSSDGSQAYVTGSRVPYLWALDVTGDAPASPVTVNTGAQPIAALVRPRVSASATCP